MGRRMVSLSAKFLLVFVEFKTVFTKVITYNASERCKKL